MSSVHVVARSHQIVLEHICSHTCLVGIRGLESAEMLRGEEDLSFYNRVLGDRASKQSFLTNFHRRRGGD